MKSTVLAILMVLVAVASAQHGGFGGPGYGGVRPGYGGGFGGGPGYGGGFGQGFGGGPGLLGALLGGARPI
ncbi:hypothetical protein Q1695_003832 [Nippostrongylus brasiliensis]|nr:hypothetical protein Q1695_003832 [Nippostrongylus brasiliensis]